MVELSTRGTVFTFIISTIIDFIWNILLLLFGISTNSQDMGAYLTLPIREKESRDFDGDFLSFGASSMQGWRMTQEDAHSCQVDFDKDNKTSLFAVYDGHGGAEVAQYTSMNFPNYLKTTDLYEKGDVKEALEEAFLGFDATLTEESVIRQLKDLAGVENENEEVDEEVKNEAAALCEEASMPLEKVLERYGGQASAGSLVYSLRKRQNFQSPMVRTKEDKSENNETVSSNNAESSMATEQKPELDDVKAKLEDKLVNGFCENDANKSQTENADSSSTEPALGPDVLNREPVSSSKIEPNTETASEKMVCDSEACSASENGTDTSNSGKQVTNEASVKTTVEEGSSQISTEGNAPESSSVEMETPGPSSSSASSSTNVTPGDEEDSEADTEEEEGDSEDEDGWNSEEADDDSDDDEEALDEMNFDEDEDDDEDDDEDAEEEGEISTMGWSEEPGADSGCTAVVALLKGRTLHVANSGDSRCVLSRGGVALEMSADHKPEDSPEKERIVKAGGRVTCDGRVNGGLNLSRALGDHSYKRNTSLGAREQMITAFPDVKSVTLCENDRFMVLACDGIWNVMSSQDVVDFVQGRLDSGVTKLSAICEEMFDFCLAPDTTGDGTGCDNMTCVIVRFNKLLDEEKDIDFEASKKRKADSDAEDSSAAKRSREELDGIDGKDL